MKKALHRTALAVTLTAFVFSALAALGATPPVRAEPGPKPKVAAAVPSARPVQGKLNLNQADEQQLRLLPGVGASKAASIVAWRKKHGRFRRVKDLRRVKGFGKKTVDKLEPYLSLTGPTTLHKGK